MNWKEKKEAGEEGGGEAEAEAEEEEEEEEEEREKYQGGGGWFLWFVPLLVGRLVWLWGIRLNQHEAETETGGNYDHGYCLLR